MAIKRKITETGIYFITFTCYNWHRLIEQTNGYDLVYDWFDILANGGHSLTGYVIMPNHLHMLLHYLGGKQSLNTIVGNGKRFLAYEIVARLEKMGNWDELKFLEKSVTPKDKAKGKKHEVWINSFDAKQCRTERFVLQKLHYIHRNPCSGKWNLVKEPHHYPHSSALFYLNGKKSVYPVKDYREFLVDEEWEAE